MNSSATKMSPKLAKLLDDPNVTVFTRDDELFVMLQPWDKEITTRYAKRIFNMIRKAKQDILDYFGRDVFVLHISDHNIDGLDETNSLLIDNAEVYPNY